MIGSHGICNAKQLLHFISVNKSYFYSIIYDLRPSSFYKSFEIPKKLGGVRRINSPQGELKSIQKIISTALYAQKQFQSYHISHGFEKNKNIISNAAIHRNKKYVLNIDLNNFFDSFHFGRVRGFFHKNKYFSFPIKFATILAQLTCFKGVLPQGAPTSPIITNLICRIFDFRILHIAKKYKVDYTRYVDDLTFSTNDTCFLSKTEIFLRELQNEVENAGFQINQKKIRLQHKNSRQIVTGLVVNKKISVPQDYYRKTRAMAHSLYSKGEFFIDGKKGTLSQLEGRFSYIDSVVSYNNKIDAQQHNLCNLSGREEEFRKFLFYKIFYKTSMPIIVTEDESDIKYIKAALKKFYVDYPRLITKINEDSFKFNIYFFRSTKYMYYFFGVPKNGITRLSNIYYFFVGKKNSNIPSYYKYFLKFNATPPFPIVLLFDNKMIAKKKTLGSFISRIKLPQDDIAFMRKNLYLPILKKANIYLATTNLVNKKNFCSIEELFSTEVLAHAMKKNALGGLEFDSMNAKSKFSQYVFDHYQEINFDNFRPFLNVLDGIIQNNH